MNICHSPILYLPPDENKLFLVVNKNFFQRQIKWLKTEAKQTVELFLV
jgi:hypothetical protein